MQNALYYLITVLIWGSTWLAIKFQLGAVSPELSIAYRFALASAVLLLYSRLRGLQLRFNLRQHAFIALQGFLLFALNYVLVYRAELYIPSGLAAILFSTIVIFNVLFGALFLGNPVRPWVVVGALLGMAGLLLIFRREISAFDLSSQRTAGLLLAVGGALSASLGNITSARNQRQGLPVVQVNAWGMGYGALFTFTLAVAMGQPVQFEVSLPYLLSLLFLALFGSVVAFGTYLTLLGNIGPDRAAYVSVLFPVIALLLSTAFEAMRWTLPAAVGMGLVLAGNALVLATGRRRPRGKSGAGNAPAPGA